MYLHKNIVDDIQHVDTYHRLYSIEMEMCFERANQPRAEYQRKKKSHNTIQHSHSAVLCRIHLNIDNGIHETNIAHVVHLLQNVVCERSVPTSISRCRRRVTRCERLKTIQTPEMNKIALEMESCRKSANSTNSYMMCTESGNAIEEAKELQQQRIE